MEGSTRKSQNLESKVNFLLQTLPSISQNNEVLDTAKNQLQEVELLLAKLKKNNDMMKTVESSAVIKAHEQTFQLLSSSYQMAEDRLNEQLLKNEKTLGSTDGDGSISVDMRRYLQQKQSLGNSLDIAEEFLTQADDTKDAVEISTQRLKRIKDKGAQTNAFFSSARSLMTAISRQKLKHTLILGTVIAICICFLIWWWLRS